MSKRIVVLSEAIANQIAAGEVVERPASIVKELLENSIDAGATDIAVELEKGGGDLIKVVDNGSGIEREDVGLVFERHATSKIQTIEDVFNVCSFGFRGEAMPSIASIARVELLTRRKDDLAGTRAILEAGVIQEIVPAGCPVGTQISVTKLFANVPARRKFLKTESTEQGACLDAVTRLALAHPAIRFKVISNGREVFVAPQTATVSERIAMVMGEDFSACCLVVSEQRGSVRLEGYISPPQYTKSNSKSIFLFVNRRFVRDVNITHAVLNAYRQVIEGRRYPAAVLFIDLPGEEVDVNVHPAKMEVRFKDFRGIYDLVSRTVAQSLAGAQSLSGMTGSASAERGPGSFVYRLAPRESTQPVSGFWRTKEIFSKQEAGQYSRQNMQQAITRDLYERSLAPKDVPVQIAETRADYEITFTGCRHLGQFADTYLVFVDDKGLLLIDQHAAHERIILERLKQTAGQKVISQPMLLPEVVSLTPAQTTLFAGCIDLLLEIGLTVEIFGRDAVAVKALPTGLSHIHPRELIFDIADQLGDFNSPLSLTERKDKILASLACRAAIKANAVLSNEEVAALCRDLEATPFNRTCPHGRPISIHFPLSEIERMFKRK